MRKIKREKYVVSDETILLQGEDFSFLKKKKYCKDLGGNKYQIGLNSKVINKLIKDGNVYFDCEYYSKSLIYFKLLDGKDFLDYLSDNQKAEVFSKMYIIESLILEDKIKPTVGKILIKILNDLLLDDCKLFIQKKILDDEYEVDLLIESEKYPPLVIECNDFDEYNNFTSYDKTEDQIIKENKQDRKCLLNGYNVMRFSGFEIYNDLQNCIGDILDYLYRDDEIDNENEFFNFL